MTEIPESERALLAQAERRLGRMILFLTPVGAGVAAWGWGGETALAFAVGGALAYLNYRWIVAVVDTLVRSTQAGRVPRRAYVKLLAPLLLLGAGLYVIFSRSLVSVGGLVGGLLLLVAAVMMEAAYQVYLAVRS